MGIEPCGKINAIEIAQQKCDKFQTWENIHYCGLPEERSDKPNMPQFRGDM